MLNHSEVSCGGHRKEVLTWCSLELLIILKADYEWVVAFQSLLLVQ